MIISIMEAITHILTGVLIQVLCFKYLIFPFNFLLTMLFAFLSHFVIDTLAKITYHTPDALKDDKFWVIWYVFTVISSISVGIIFFIPYFLGGLFANIPDILDWGILRPIQSKKKQENPESTWGEGYFIHPIIDWIRDKPFFWLPNWNYKKRAIIVELITITILLILIVFYLL